MHRMEQCPTQTLRDPSTLLAEHLVRMGVRPEKMVPMCMEKSKLAVVSILAIFKAGGVYVPLDPSFPEARLRAIARQLDAPVCLTSSTQDRKCSRFFQQCMVVEDYLERVALEDPCGSLKEIAIMPCNAAYAIFT